MAMKNIVHFLNKFLFIILNFLVPLAFGCWPLAFGELLIYFLAKFIIYFRCKALHFYVFSIHYFHNPFQESVSINN
ncbi:MAG: hypothetical protein CSA94_00110 [Bacteroidetes bacterium]|nr:MAG: hypothetical protein CSA94_00110 [Bacteroidota bacterium]